MSASIEPRDDGENPAVSAQDAESVRLPDTELESVEASVRTLLAQSTHQARTLDPLTASSADLLAGTAAGMPFAGFPGIGLPPSYTPPAAPPEPKPILELEGEEFEDELAALTDWVDDFLMDTYGAEITTAAPWCEKWQEHLDVVAWLHALWMAYQQHKDPEAGPSGMFVWHRDFLTHAMAHIRAAGGPLSACQTDPERPEHRLLHGPGPSTRPHRTSGQQTGAETSGPTS
ncbi:DUF4913 domain-containing protein [Streptomyces sp. NPDC059070]|uniref:DUF4913 domain-containing protein n=1 Tax=Streptomyces sp. NPDC059070 TaxID=3346713 RepID=UPI00367F3DF7